MRNPRPLHRYVRYVSVPPLKSRILSTNDDIEDEIFAALCYFADVPDVGRELLTSHGIDKAKLDEVFFAMQSYLRQSRTFYSAARHASLRASPLIYYYAFLNLAKAVICLHKPDRVASRIGHGLTHELKTASLAEQVLRGLEDGVFPLLYEILLKNTLPKEVQFSVLSLLTYCADISQEIQETKGVSQSTLPVLSRAMMNVPEKQAFIVLGIPLFATFEECESAKRRFFEHFDEVTLDTRVTREIFGLYGEVASGHRFFESKLTVPTKDQGLPLREVENMCYSALKPYVVENPHFEEEEPDFYLSRPLSAGAEIPFSQPIALYAAFYFLSSLVRYYPLYFERAVASRDVWMIESFVRSTPTTLLRYLGNQVFGENRRYRSR